jgi:hypothetical protein
MKHQEMTFPVPELRIVSHRRGRPPKYTQPPIPQELLDGMSDLEKEWYFYFIKTIKEEYPDLSRFDLIQVHVLLAPCFVSCMRLETQQMSKKELVMMSRQDPRTQFNNLMNSLSVRRRDRKQEKHEEKSEVKDYIMGLVN